MAARYRRILRHRGHKKAIVAVAHNLLVTAYYVLARQTTYQELGADYYTTAAIPSGSPGGRCRPSSNRATESPSNASPEAAVIF